MLKQAKLLIDQDCPMCKAYGKGFIKAKLIDSHTLSPYQSSSTAITSKVNMDRARNEIALVMEDETVYGIDALIKILTQNNTLFYKVLNLKWIYKVLNFFYHFISYNRKVIYPVAQSSQDKYTCTPDMHKGFRWAYILFVALVTGLILNYFSSAVFAQMGLSHSPYIEWIMCFGQIIWQAMLITMLQKDKTLDYLGNMSTVSLIGGILVSIVLLANYLITMNAILLLTAFGAIVCLMLYEHIRRCSIMGLSFCMTISWVLYRTIFLILLIYIHLI